MSAPEGVNMNEVFVQYDKNNTGTVAVQDLPALLEELGVDGAAAQDVLGKVPADGAVTFGELQRLLSGEQQLPSEAPDPKVMEFLRILDEYRLKCEEESNYKEAERAHRQLENLRKQEEKRQRKALKARQIAERQDVQIAHNMQYAEFNNAWDKYMQEYDQMAQMYIQQMTEKHAIQLREYQEKLHKEMVKKPPKFSKELLEWRRRQHMLAKQKNYAEAQKIKRIADLMEDKERNRLDADCQSYFARKEAKFRQRQQAELTALLKRIDGRRKEHIAQRNLDSKRLLQRNRNVQAVLESKQMVEERVALKRIKESLAPKRGGGYTVSAKPTVVPDVGTKGSPGGKGDSTFLTTGSR